MYAERYLSPCMSPPLGSLSFWQEKAYDESQKYKEGKFILEKINLYKEEELGGWW